MLLPSLRPATVRVALLALLLGVPSLLFAWGSWGHQHINRAAVLALPDNLRVFFYNHVDFMTIESVMPDVRIYSNGDRVEGPRHYINLENYGTTNVDSLPQTWADAQAKYDAATLAKNGMLPWRIQDLQAKLTQAFKDGKRNEILFLAADLAHYLGDAHVPLHAALNHDGQLTGQKGIHSFWESQLPEKFGNSYNFRVGAATHIPNVTAETWRIIRASRLSADTVLAVDKKLMAEMPATEVYQVDAAGAVVKNKYGQAKHSVAYATRYHEQLKHMVERQMRASVQDIANYWYTAWVDAGKPDLSKLDAASTTLNSARNLKLEEQLLRKGQLTEVTVDTEF
jgi:hypothetical protein